MTAFLRSSGRVRTCLLAALLATACSDPAAPPEPASITLEGSSPGTAVVGTALTPSFVVLDSRGRPVRGVTVTFQAGFGSSVQTTTAETDANGRVSPGQWMLGTDAGAQTLRVTAGTVSFTLSVQAQPGAPASLQALPSNPDAGAVGQPLSPAPGVIVRDAFGNPVSGVQVTFAAAAGSGAVEGAVRSTNVDGIARPGAWILGQQPGTQVLAATTTGLSTTLTVEAVLFTAPASVQALEANPDTAEANEAVEPVPGVIVRDEHGNPVPGVQVEFSAGPFSGSVTGSVQTTDENGIARPDSWTLGASPGEQHLLARVGSLAARVPVIALGEPFRIFAGNATTCPVGTDACKFTVTVTTRAGVPVPGATVVWSAPSGATLTTTTNSRGRTAARNLIRDGALGTYTQTARLEASGEEVTFTYQLVQAGQYDIEVRFIGEATASQQAIFRAAKERWEEVITGNLPQVNLTAEAGDCSIDHPAVNEVIDDLLIYIQVDSIDGVGKTLGSAGPCYIRNESRLPVMGIMRLDLADVEALEDNGQLFDVVLHEMGHVIGIGTLWGELDLLIGTSGSGQDPFFTGSYAAPEFVLVGGNLINGVPVEAGGGAGTALGHWRESIFSDELMTGFICAPSGCPLSTVTIASLLDLGYQVNFAAADAYVVPGGIAGYGPMARESGFQLIEIPLPKPRTVR